MNLTISTPQNQYTFTLYPIGTNFYQIAGIYIFIILPNSPFEGGKGFDIKKEKRQLQIKNTQHPASIIQPYSLLYLGITNNFRGRFNQHHKIQQAIALGMTHIGILKKHSTRKRKSTERDILKHLNPPLNQTWLNSPIKRKDLRKTRRNSPF